MQPVLGMLRRASLPIAALFLVGLVFWLAWDSKWAGLTLTVCAFIVGLDLYDWSQKSFTLTRNYPVAARIRWLFYDLRPFLRQYIVEGDLEGTPYSFEARNLVYARARGKTDTNPFGSERNMDEAGHSWIAHSIAPASDAEDDPRVLVGNEQTARPYNASVLNISAMSFGALSAKAIEALSEIVAAAGLRHPKELRPHRLTTQTSPVEARPMAELHTYLPENVLLDSP